MWKRSGKSQREKIKKQEIHRGKKVKRKKRIAMVYDEEEKSVEDHTQ